MAVDPLDLNDAIFYEEWLACLRAHYIYALSIDDQDNAGGLRLVLLDQRIPVEALDELVAAYSVAPTQSASETMPQSEPESELEPEQALESNAPPEMVEAESEAVGEMVYSEVGLVIHSDSSESPIPLPTSDPSSAADAENEAQTALSNEQGDEQGIEAEMPPENKPSQEQEGEWRDFRGAPDEPDLYQPTLF